MTDEPDEGESTGPRPSSRWKWVALALCAVGLFVLARVAPVDRWLEALRGWVDSLGAWGPVVYGLVYVLAALLFVPGAAVTLVAGPVFGLWLGTAVVSVASTTAAALAFLIARHVAREAVARRLAGNQRLEALDAAIERGGWRIVGLLRLSPLVPFSVGNYLYGLTGVAFWPYLLASWVGMLPGTFMYVYLGHAGARGLEAASGGESSTGELVLTGVGLAATVAVTVYVTRLAMKELRSRPGVDVGGSAAAVSGRDR